MESNTTIDLNKLRIGKTPLISIANPTHIVGIIDCSGSMSSRFPDLCLGWNSFKNSIGQENITTVLFCHESNLLEGDLKREHCRGTTNILSGFNLALEQIDLLSKKGKSDFTILFISDGVDNNQNTIQQRVNDMSNIDSKLTIKLICLGVGSGFPTFISMDLRKKIS